MGDMGDSVESFFGKHAADYSRSQSHAKGADLDAMIRALAPKGHEVALDAATGTGFTALALARLVAKVTGVDMTEEMLDQARSLAQKEGVSNVEFEKGDVLHTRFDDGSFDIVTSRRATHHFRDVPGFLREAKRVLRATGRLGIVDMAPPEGAEGFMNKVERLRDSSHVEAFAPSAWKAMVAGAGLKVLSTEVLGEIVPFERWLYPVGLGGAEEASIREAWRSAPEQTKNLLGASFNGENIKAFTKNRIILVAAKTP